MGIATSVTPILKILRQNSFVKLLKERALHFEEKREIMELKSINRE